MPPVAAKAKSKNKLNPLPTKVTYLPAGVFKARCLKLMDEVNASGGEIVITKRGKPVAKLTPMPKKVPSLFGCMKGMAEELGDIMAPTGVTWDEIIDEWDELNK